ncbi:MAG: hypothetical protein WC867_02600, partial [Candidatus Pacearchaeota archaeon]
MKKRLFGLLILLFLINIISAENINVNQSSGYNGNLGNKALEIKNIDGIIITGNENIINIDKSGTDAFVKIGENKYYVKDGSKIVLSQDGKIIEGSILKISKKDIYDLNGYKQPLPEGSEVIYEKER